MTEHMPTKEGTSCEWAIRLLGVSEHTEEASTQKAHAVTVPRVVGAFEHIHQRQCQQRMHKMGLNLGLLSP